MCPPLIPAEERVTQYMKKCLNGFKTSELEELIPEYFDMEWSEVEEGIRKRKITMSKRNLVDFISLHTEKEKWSIPDILGAAFNLDLEYTQRYHGKYTWVAHKFNGDSSRNEVPEVDSDLRRAMRIDKRDALVLTKYSDGIFWISVVMKNLKKIGLYKRPFYIALSESGRYFFTKSVDSDDILQVLSKTLGYNEFRRIKLTGRNIKSLLKLLARKETVDKTKRPIYQGGKAIVGEYGTDMTQKKSYEEFYNKCVDNDDEIYIQNYKISAVKSTWTDPDMPMLHQMQFDSSLTFSGDIARIMKALPIAKIVKPPFPDFLVNFSVEGKNSVRVAGIGGDSQDLSQKSQ